MFFWVIDLDDDQGSEENGVEKLLLDNLFANYSRMSRPRRLVNAQVRVVMSLHLFGIREFVSPPWN